MKRYIRCAESQDLLQEVTSWAQGRTKRFKKFERDGMYFEKHSIQDLINNYIRYFNQNVYLYGDGFAADWDSDDTMSILYKDGKIVAIHPEFYDGFRKIRTDNIDSIILDGGWGTAFAGPSITFEDYTVYDDIPDIRADFTSGHVVN